jgi:hypothetical protein
MVSGYTYSKIMVDRDAARLGMWMGDASQVTNSLSRTGIVLPSAPYRCAPSQIDLLLRPSTSRVLCPPLHCGQEAWSPTMPASSFAAVNGRYPRNSTASGRSPPSHARSPRIYPRKSTFSVRLSLASLFSAACHHDRLYAPGRAGRSRGDRGGVRGRARSTETPSWIGGTGCGVPVYVKADHIDRICNGV